MKLVPVCSPLSSSQPDLSSPLSASPPPPRCPSPDFAGGHQMYQAPVEVYEDDECSKNACLSGTCAICVTLNKEAVPRPASAWACQDCLGEDESNRRQLVIKR